MTQVIMIEDKRRQNNTLLIGEGISFERTRRITGYLCRIERFNNAKRAEERDRMYHG